MKVSLGAIRFINQHYNSAGDPAPEGVDALSQKIGSQLGAIEETVDFGSRFKDVVIVRVASCEPHPNADKLKVCLIDDGGVTKHAKRQASGYVQVVCGAPNVRAGLLAAWLPPGAVVPSTFGDNEFVLEARDLRGVTSNGMLASAKELGLSDDHEGILEINEDHAPGTSFAQAYRLDGDVIIDIENKMFTHRPDCFGWLGIARELEGIQHRPYKSPDWYTLKPDFPAVETEELKLEVKNEIPGLVPRFTAIAMRGVKVGPSPLWVQVNLARVGLRPINNIVDYTNYYMILTGQPIHAYDYDKVMAQDAGAPHATIVVRHPKKGEKITLLNGKTIEPHQDAMMVASQTKLICLGGAMGGADTEVDSTTKNIILEAANWDMYAIRRTSMAYGIFTDAVTRFNKGQSPLQTPAVLWKISDQIRRFGGGKIASPLVDDCRVAQRALHSGSLHTPVTVSSSFINSRLGLDLTAAKMAKLLENVEFRVAHDDGKLTVAAPFWRTDIVIAEDVVEEIGRLYGYDRLPLTLPVRDLTPPPISKLFALKSRIRSIFAAAGANEVLTYNFVHSDLLIKTGQDPSHAYQLGNALSPDLQYMRMSLLPSLLEKVHPNIKAGFDELALFEMNKSHNVLHAPKNGEAPQEIYSLGLVIAASGKTAPARPQAPYYQARAYLDHLATQLGASFSYLPIAEDVDYPIFKPFNQRRSAVVVLDGEPFGIIGEFRPEVSKKLKLPQFAAGFELGLESLLPYVDARSRYQPLLRFPSTGQDICLRIAAGVAYSKLFESMEKAFPADEDLKVTIKPSDIYQREGNDSHKQVTFHITLQHAQKTLTTQEANGILDKAVARVTAALGAKRV